jgi:hypothetical protein
MVVLSMKLTQGKAQDHKTTEVILQTGKKHFRMECVA